MRSTATGRDTHAEGSQSLLPLEGLKSLKDFLRRVSPVSRVCSFLSFYRCALRGAPTGGIETPFGPKTLDFKSFFR